jgi:hypothetical protein
MKGLLQSSKETPTIEVSNTLGRFRSAGKNGRISGPQTNLLSLRADQIVYNITEKRLAPKRRPPQLLAIESKERT